MSKVESRSKNEELHKIFVGVDYGTTFTGASWIASTSSNISDVSVISSWPGPSRVGEAHPKTPSCIAYENENPTLIKDGNQWGYFVTPKMKSYAWTKLLLDKSTKATKFDDPLLSQTLALGLLKTPKGIQASKVCADYLREIYRYIVKELEQRLSPEVLRLTPMDFLFTVPAIWSDKAKQATIDAAREAGFSSREIDDIRLMPEPEAAAVATISAYKTENVLSDLEPGKGILVCDCGGGTVDITTFEIMALEPELKLSDLVVGNGGKCGSTNIDRLFHKWMSHKFGDAFDKLAYEKKGPGSRFMKDFESRKRDFGSSNLSDSCEVTLRMPDVDESAYYDPDESSVIIPRTDMKGFFDPVVRTIIAILESQLKDLAKKGIQTKVAILILVGGFGDSRYLNDELRQWCRKKGDIRLICPSDPQAAIMKGAAYSGLKNIVPSSRLCRRHYGFSWHIPFVAGKHDKYEHYYDEWSEKEWVKGILEWPLKKVLHPRNGQVLANSRQGDTIEKGTKISRNRFRVVEENDSRIFYSKLYTSVVDPPPKHVSEAGVEYLGEIRYDCSDVPLKDLERKRTSAGKVWKLETDIEVLFGEKEGVLKFQVTREGRVVGKTSIKFQ